MSDDLSRIVDEMKMTCAQHGPRLMSCPCGRCDEARKASRPIPGVHSSTIAMKVTGGDPLWPLREMLAVSMHNLGACLAHVGHELAAHARWRLTDPEWDKMIAEISAGPPRKPDEAEAECDRIAERIIAARKP